jgi:hypothetical protein
VYAVPIIGVQDTVVIAPYDRPLVTVDRLSLSKAPAPKHKPKTETQKEKTGYVIEKICKDTGYAQFVSGSGRD